jgi:hypothetical protein
MDWQAITSVDYWSKLNPHLTISQGHGAAPGPAWPADDAFAAALPQRLAHDGYFKMPDVLAPADVAPLVTAMETLKEAGWLPAFAYVYDEAWQVFGRVRRALTLALGEGYRQMPSMWAWYVEASDGTSGWRQHRDRGPESLRPDLSPTAMTVWVALTDATPDNGCMYVVPAHRDPDYRDGGPSDAKLQDVRALPVPAGTALAWTHALAHWGGRSSDFAANPRLSLSVEFQAADVPAWEAPLLDPMVLPSFEQRIALICKGMLQYRHMHLERFSEGDVEMATRLRDEGLPQAAV